MEAYKVSWRATSLLLQMKGQVFPIVAKQMKLESVMQLQDDLNKNRRLHLRRKINLV